MAAAETVVGPPAKPDWQALQDRVAAAERRLQDMQKWAERKNLQVQQLQQRLTELERAPMPAEGEE
jgi:hypothetical protein